MKTEVRKNIAASVRERLLNIAKKSGEPFDQVGRLWASKSGGKCRFLMVFENEQGHDVRGQLDAIIG